MRITALGIRSWFYPSGVRPLVYKTSGSSFVNPVIWSVLLYVGILSGVCFFDYIGYWNIKMVAMRLLP
jgi:hypothetical protein